LAVRGSFVQTGTILDKILANTVREVAERKGSHPLPRIREAAEKAAPARDFVGALHRETVALIAEVKHASPSKGVLIEDFDPVRLGTTYAENGAAAISVLTDARFFQGQLDYLTRVREAVGVPVLRKDFIVDPYQVYEARAAGADAILLIAAALGNGQLADLHALAHELGLAALVEVHDESEIARAARVGAPLVGVNNRDLKTFSIDLGTTARLAALAPEGVTLVAESGVQSAEDVRRMGALGAHAVLVGEALVKSGELAEAVRDFSSQPRGLKR
jgi:indole-3-glycerol phosphate synthase